MHSSCRHHILPFPALHASSKMTSLITCLSPHILLLCLLPHPSPPCLPNQPPHHTYDFSFPVPDCSVIYQTPSILMYSQYSAFILYVITWYLPLIISLYGVRGLSLAPSTKREYHFVGHSRPEVANPVVVRVLALVKQEVNCAQEVTGLLVTVTYR